MAMNDTEEGEWEIKKHSMPVWHIHKLQKRKKPLEHLEIVSRDEWVAWPNSNEFPLELPVKHVRHTQTFTDPCTTKEECINMLQRLQDKQMAQGMPDIQYNFIIGGDGNVYEGRGWLLDATRIEDLDPLTEDCIDIAFVGKYKPRGEDIPEDMRKKAELLVQHGLHLKHIHCCFKNIPFRTDEG